MKKINFKKLIRKTACILAALVTIVTYSLYEPLAAYAGDSEQAYTWRKVETIEELQNAIAKVHNTKFSDMDRDYSKDTYWTRVLLIWKSGDNYYFCAKGANSSSADWYGVQVASNLGVKPGELTFLTRTGLDTPWLKECTNGQKYSQDNQYCLRLCEEGTENMTDYFAAVELSFYGISYHAITDDEFNFKVTSGSWSSLSWRHSGAANRDMARSFNFVFCPGWSKYFNNYDITEKEKNSLLAAYNYTVKEARTAYTRYGSYTYYVDVHPSTAEKIKWVQANCTDTDLYDNGIFTRKITANGYKEATGVTSYDNLFKPMLDSYASRNTQAEDGTAYFYYNFNGNICQRFWCKDGNKIYIDDKSAFDSQKEECVSFYVYIGTPTTIATYNSSQTLPAGIIYFNDMEEISAGVTLTVSAGTTMVVSGQLINKGRIVVDGGTLIIKDVLYNDGNKPRDGLTLMRGGTCIVEETGCYLSKGSFYGWNEITVTSGSMLYVEGVVVVPYLSVNYNSTLRGAADSVLCVGSYINSSVDVKNYTIELLKKNQNAKLNTLMNEATIDTGYALYVYGHSSLISEGCVYTPDVSPGKSGSYLDFWRETDLARTIKQAMRW